MRILDIGTDKALKNICLYLTSLEAKEMLEDLKRLLSDNTEQHSHVSDENYEYEVTLTIYDYKNLDKYDERSKKLIKEEI